VKAENARYDWEIFQEIVHRLQGKNGSFTPEKPEVKLEMALAFGKYQLSLEKLKETPHGIDLGELEPCFPRRLLTADKRINLAPQILVHDLDRLRSEARLAVDDDFPFSLIGRRHLRDCNSWMHNYERLVKGKDRCTLMINELDAEGLGLLDHQTVKVSSRVGTVELPCEITANIARGVVSIPHGYGHGRKAVRLDVAADHAGVSINDLTDETVIDELTGNAAFSSVRVRIEA
jgi:anaerobic selenocysteine-containing dehydrogenase